MITYEYCYYFMSKKIPAVNDGFAAIILPENAESKLADTPNFSVI